MSKYLAFILLFFLPLSKLLAQAAPRFLPYTEITLMPGTTCYAGDLSPYALFKTELAKPAIGLAVKRNFNRRWNYRFAGMYGSLYGNDALNQNSFLRNRNLAFHTQLWETSFGFEFNFFPYEIGSKQFPATFYLFGGLGVFGFNPKAFYGGEQVSLRELTTEGQELSNSEKKKYSPVQICMPFGFGGKFSFSKRFAIGIEWGFRKLFTDYLDDVSTTYADARLLAKERSPAAENLSGSIRRTGTNPGNTGRMRGFSWNTDWYSMAALTLSLKIPNKQKCPGYGD
ncbi:MAG: DUF6089 family protein [Bacteroidota bacterium]|jgi:hypothetical protein